MCVCVCVCLTWKGDITGMVSRRPTNVSASDLWAAAPPGTTDRMGPKVLATRSTRDLRSALTPAAAGDEVAWVGAAVASPPSGVVVMPMPPLTPGLAEDENWAPAGGGGGVCDCCTFPARVAGWGEEAAGFVPPPVIIRHTSHGLACEALPSPTVDGALVVVVEVVGVGSGLGDTVRGLIAGAPGLDGGYLPNCPPVAAELDLAAVCPSWAADVWDHSASRVTARPGGPCLPAAALLRSLGSCVDGPACAADPLSLSRLASGEAGDVPGGRTSTWMVDEAQGP
jgi:hypothetical protein